jgi:hypothetical protein
MDIKEAKNLYFNEIESFLKPKGFKVLKSRQIAERKNPIGFNQIFFDTVKSYDFTYSILCNLWVRNDKIQVIKGEIIPKRANPDKPTIITNIFTYSKKIEREDIDFEKHGGHLINFEDKASIDKWITGFTRFINEAGFAFFDNFKTDADFDQWFNEPILNGTYDFSKGMIWNDSVSGLVAAKLVENPEYENLYGIWHEKLTEASDINSLAELERMYVYLKSFSIQ